MKGQAIAFFLFGFSLVVILIAIIIFYYSKKRQARIEEPKYKMFDDED
jgi:cbb3-type cytochrome oxidase subunit 3